MLSLVSSQSHHSQCMGGARDIMQGEPGVGVIGLGSLTSLLKPGVIRHPPHVPHQIAHSFGPRSARGRSCGPSCSAPGANRGTTRPPIPPHLPPPPLQNEDPGASTSQLTPTSFETTAGGLTATPLVLPCGLWNIAATYASSVSTSLSAYTNLPGHHLRSMLDLIAMPPALSYPKEPTSGEDE